MYIGCHTEGEGGRGVGIAVARREPATGGLDPLGLAAAMPSPSFLAAHPTLPVIYAVHERAEGAVSAWRIGPGGVLTRLGGTATGGADPCHVAVIGDHLAVANYGGGSVSLHPLREDGVVAEQSDISVHSGHGPVPERQAAPHVHQVTPAGEGGLRAVDLGLDAVYAYPIDREKGRLGPAAVSPVRPGSGPRHLAGDGVGRVYLAGELDATVTAYTPDSVTGQLREHAHVPLGGGHPSEIAISDDDRFLYVANRGPDTIAVLALDEGRPRLVGEVPSGGSWPRHFALLGGHLYVANERSDAVVTFRVDPDSGLPEPTGEVWPFPSPTCVLGISGPPAG